MHVKAIKNELTIAENYTTLTAASGSVRVTAHPDCD